MMSCLRTVSDLWARMWSGMAYGGGGAGGVTGQTDREGIVKGWLCHDKK